MTDRFEVIESRVWQNNAGRTASIYGANPWFTEAQRIAEGWQMVSRGWTVQNPHTGQIGICRAPWKDRAAAEAYATAHPPSRIGYGD